MYKEIMYEDMNGNLKELKNLINEPFLYELEYFQTEDYLKLKLGGILHKDINQPTKIKIPNLYNTNDRVIGISQNLFCASVLKSNLEKLDLGNSITEIYTEGFCSFKHLNEVNFPEKLEYIHGNAFKKCDLKEVILPDTVKKIMWFAFDSNINLKKIKLPSLPISKTISLDEFIYPNAFFNCPNIEDITFYSYTLKTLPNLLINFNKIKKVTMIINNDDYVSYLNFFSKFTNLKEINIIYEKDNIIDIKKRILPKLPINKKINYILKKECENTIDNNIKEIEEIKKEIDIISSKLPANINNKINDKVNNILINYISNLNNKIPNISNQIKLSLEGDYRVNESLLIIELRNILDSLKKSNSLLDISIKLDDSLDYINDNKQKSNDYIDIINNILNISNNLLPKDKLDVENRLKKIINNYINIINNKINIYFNDIIDLSLNKEDYNKNIKKDLNSLLDKVELFYNNTYTYVDNLNNINKNLYIIDNIFDTSKESEIFSNINENNDIICNFIYMLLSIKDKGLIEEFKDTLLKYKNKLENAIENNRYKYLTLIDYKDVNNKFIIDFNKELSDIFKYISIYYQISNCRKLLHNKEDIIFNNNGLDYGRCIQEVIIDLKNNVNKLSNKEKEEKIFEIKNIINEYLNEMVKNKNIQSINKLEKEMLNKLSKIKLELDIFFIRNNYINKRKTKLLTLLFD